jgi:hypothetical protein
MASIDPLLQRKEDFAAGGAHEGVSIVAKHRVYMITWLGPRTDRRPSSSWGSGTRC